MVTIRIDDISANTNFVELRKQVALFHDKGFKIIAGVTLFAKDSDDGAVYPGNPFKDRPNTFFWSVDKYINMQDVYDCGIGVKEIASHGLFHADHSKLSYDAQEESIVSSCNLLKTYRFIAPFNKINSDTWDVIDKHGIGLVNSDDWCSLETEVFDESYEFWYYHPWRMRTSEIHQKLYSLASK